MLFSNKKTTELLAVSKHWIGITFPKKYNRHFREVETTPLRYKYYLDFCKQTQKQVGKLNQFYFWWRIRHWTNFFKATFKLNAKATLLLLGEQGDLTTSEIKKFSDAFNFLTKPKYIKNGYISNYNRNKIKTMKIELQNWLNEEKIITKPWQLLNDQKIRQFFFMQVQNTHPVLKETNNRQWPIITTEDITEPYWNGTTQGNLPLFIQGHQNIPFLTTYLNKAIEVTHESQICPEGNLRTTFLQNSVKLLLKVLKVTNPSVKKKKKKKKVPRRIKTWQNYNIEATETIKAHFFNTPITTETVKYLPTYGQFLGLKKKYFESIHAKRWGFFYNKNKKSFNRAVLLNTFYKQKNKNINQLIRKLDNFKIETQPKIKKNPQWRAVGTPTYFGYKKWVQIVKKKKNRRKIIWANHKKQIIAKNEKIVTIFNKQANINALPQLFVQKKKPIVQKFLKNREPWELAKIALMTIRHKNKTTRADILAWKRKAWNRIEKYAPSEIPIFSTAWRLNKKWILDENKLLKKKAKLYNSTIGPIPRWWESKIQKYTKLYVQRKNTKSIKVKKKHFKNIYLVHAVKK